MIRGIEGEGDGGEWEAVLVGGHYYRFVQPSRVYGKEDRGDWNAEETYKASDFARFDEGLYVCQADDSKGDRPDLSPASWCLIGKKVTE